MDFPIPQPSRKVVPRELLDIRERAWRPRLAGLSLISEAELPQNHLEQAGEALGSLLTSALKRGSTPNLARWPACVACATTGIATEHYKSGTFWPELWKVTRVPPLYQESKTWGTNFLRSLEILGKETFPDQHLKYVGPIVMHSGIPTYCLTDVFELLLERTARDNGLDAHSFYQWAIDREHRLNNLDMPARRFISLAGDYSLDTLDRCLDLLDRLQGDPGVTPSAVNLPERFLAPARTALEKARAKGIVHTGSKTRHQAGRTVKPRLCLDPYAQGVHVVLPTTGDSDDGSAVWRITTDDGVHTARSRSVWGSGTDATVRTTFVLPTPTRSVRVGLAGSTLEERLELIDPADPLLVFDTDGALLGASLGLPAGAVWVMYPSDQRLLHAGEVTDLGGADVPYGWDGWTLVQLSLEEAAWLRLGEGPRRPVRGRSRPRVERVSPIAGMTTTYGAPVYGELPLVTLPDTDDAAITWTVEVLSEDGRLLRNASTTGGTTVSPLRELPRPVLGSFTVNVRGPLGRGLRHQTAVAEGMGISCDPAVRVLTSAGLAPATAEVTGPAGTAAELSRDAFGPVEPSRVVRLRSGSAALTVAVTPAHFQVLSTGEDNPQWRPQPLRLDADRVAEAGDLLVRVPAGTRLDHLSVLAEGEVVQQVFPSGRSGESTVRYPLPRLAETASSRKVLEVVVGYQGQVMPLVRIRPGRLATGAQYDDGTISLDGFPGIDGVFAAVYPHHAPWLRPPVLPVSDSGDIVLPEEFRDCGPMQVLLHMDDPWSTFEWPKWPDRLSPDCLTCEAPGYLQREDPQETLLSLILAGIGSVLDVTPTEETAARLWLVLGMADELRALGMHTDFAEPCAETLGSRPMTALLAHGSAELSAEDSTRTLILSGIAAARQDDRVLVYEATDLWHRLPTAAALATNGFLPRVPLDPGSWLPEHAELFAEIQASCGAEALEILDGEPDPAAAVGRFDSATERLAQMSAERLDAIWRAAKVVPEGLLSRDSRGRAARQLFDARNRFELHGLREAARAVTIGALALCGQLPETYRGPASRLINARRPDHGQGWQDLPAASAAFAVVARLAARGVTACADQERRWRSRWSQFAAAAPDIVTLDIVLAELTLAGAERAHLFKEHQ